MSNYSTCLITSDIDQSQSGYDGYNCYFLDASNNNVDITLTNNYVSNGLYYYFIRTDVSNNVVTLSAPNGYTINGNASLNINTNQTCEIIFNNNNWISTRFSYT